jgi:hypothetical protein
MLQAVDTWLYNRLRKIQHNNAPIPVHSYGPDREKGEFEPPCLAFSRMYIRIDMERAHPTVEVPVAQAAQTTITVPPQMIHDTGVTLTGPVKYTIKPYPTPITVFYRVHALGSKKSHADSLQLGLLQAFPPGYQPEISDQYPLVLVSDIENIDQLDAPLFESVISLSVGTLWIDRLEGYDVDSIRFIDFETSVEDESEYEGI